MEKLTKDLYIKHARRLEVIINDKSPFIKFLNKPDFKNVLQNQLNILFALQKKFKVKLENDRFKAENLSINFNSLTKSNFNLDPKFKLDDDADYLDNMNYLVTYCSNIYRVNLDDLVSGKKVNVTEQNVKIRPQADEKSSYGSAMFEAGAMGMGGQFTDPRQNPFVVGQATARLQREIISGQFYRFKTKPKAIPIIKWIATILVMLTSLGLILMSIFAFMANGIKADFGGDVGVQPVSTITDGIFFLLFSGIGVYNSVMFFKTNLSQNPNDKYYFSWQIILIFIVGAIFAVLFCINSVFELGFFYKYNESTNTQTIGSKAWHYIWFVNLSFIVACIVPIIVGSIFNPKIDNRALEKRLMEIIEQIISGSFPKSVSADMQKPIEVSNPEQNQKDDKNKK